MHLLIPLAVLLPILHALPAPSITISPQFQFGQVASVAPVQPAPKAKPAKPRGKHQ